MPKYYLEGCGFKKVFDSPSYQNAAAIFLTYCANNTQLEDLTPLIMISEKGFYDDLLCCNDYEAIDDCRIILTYLALKLAKLDNIANEHKRLLIEQFPELVKSFGI